MTTELPARPERANQRAAHTANQVANGRASAPLADPRYPVLSVLVAALLAPSQHTPQHADNPAGAPACVAVRK